MAIPVLCPGCGKRFKAPDRGAGRTVPCPACTSPIAIPAVLTTDDEEYHLADEPAKAPRAPAAPAVWQPAATANRLAAPPAAPPLAAPVAVIGQSRSLYCIDLAAKLCRKYDPERGLSTRTRGVAVWHHASQALEYRTDGGG